MHTTHSSGIMPLGIALLFTVTLSCPPGRVANAAEAGHADSLVDDYGAALQSLDRAKIQNQYLQQLIDNQEAAKSAAGRQRDNYRRLGPEIIPLMTQMIESLASFVELDLPFHLEQRRARVQKLRANLGQPEITVAEKFRQIFEAYQIEMDFGRDIDATVGWLEANGPRREVTFLRVGRIVLAYQTHDRSETGFFNPASRQWELLPDEYRNFVSEGLRIANKQAAPVLLKLPVAAPEPAK